ncbi:MAG: hypothetical protein ACE5FU_10550, partial [Nitrospinota bacterium]
MQKVKIHLILILCLFYYLLVPPRLCTADTFISLVYHNVGAALSGDKFAVRTVDLVEQFEYLATHGYNPVSMEQIIRSHNTGKRLPEKAVLITVDDGLE